jgi:chromosome partitioning protein
MPAKIISIAAHKGGVGKTVSTMALGASLARAGKRTLIVDCDPQSHSGMGLGIVPEEKEPTLRELFSEPPTPMKRLIRDTHIPGLSLLPSTIRLARTAQYLYGRPKREELLKRGLEQVRGEFDFIVVDLPPSLGVLTECGIAAADLVVIPCQMKARATEGLVDLLEVIEIIKGEDFTDWRIL